MEECGLAAGEVVGCDSIKALSRMNSAVVMFLDSIDKVNILVERGIVMRNTQTAVFPLNNPSKKVILSNLPPFVSDDALERELSRHGQLVSAIKMMSSGCKSPKLKHAVGFRRYVYVILKAGIDDLSLAMRFKVDGFDYTIYATTEAMKCFGCGQAGHAVHSCPDEAAARRLVGPEPVAPGPVLPGPVLPGPVAPESVARRALPEAVEGSGVTVVENLETEQQVEVAEKDKSNAPTPFEIVTISNSVYPKSGEQTQESQSIAETSQVDMTGDSVNEDQIMVQKDGTLIKVPPNKRKQKKR